MVWINVEVNIDEIETNDLIDELEERGYDVRDYGRSGDKKEIIHDIWLLRRNGKSYDHLMDTLIYETLGRVV